MVDVRESILARLLVILGTIEGVGVSAGNVQAVGRNIEDVPGLARPAIILHDGAEEFSRADRPSRMGFIRPQGIELTPGMWILAGANAADVGTLLNTFRARLIAAVLGDAELWAIVGTNGDIKYRGCERLPAGPESKEGRMELTFVFTYVLKLTDLSAA